MADVTNCWCSVADVLAFTGVVGTEDQVVIAQNVIEGHINRNFRAADADGADAYWLRRAVAWQARFVGEHPEVFGLVGGLTSLSQDGMSVSWSDGNGGASGGVKHVSPVAKSFLNNLRAGANTSLRVNSAFGRGVGRRSAGPGWRSVGRRGWR